MVDHGIKDLNEQAIGSDYAPKRRVDLTELEKAMADPARQYPNYNYSSTNEVKQIQEGIKKLTHRQMRDMCKLILADAESINKTDLPDVLDRFAHGD